MVETCRYRPKSHNASVLRLRYPLTIPSFGESPMPRCSPRLVRPFPRGFSVFRPYRDWWAAAITIQGPIYVTRTPRKNYDLNTSHPGLSIILKNFAMSTAFDMSALQPLYAAPILLIVGYLPYSFVFHDKRRKHMPPLSVPNCGPCPRRHVQRTMSLPGPSPPQNVTSVCGASVCQVGKETFPSWAILSVQTA